MQIKLFILLCMLSVVTAVSKAEEGITSVNALKAFDRARADDARKAKIEQQRSFAAEHKAEAEAAGELKSGGYHTERDVDNLCRELDRSNEILRRLPPVRTQGNQAWCYAMVAADLASFATGQNISAAQIALNYGVYGPHDKIDDPFDLPCRHRPEAAQEGDEILAFNLARERGFCREERFPMEPFASMPLRHLEALIQSMANKDQPPCKNLKERVERLIGGRSVTEIVKSFKDPPTTKRLLQTANARCGSLIHTNLFLESFNGGIGIYRNRLALVEMLKALKKGEPASVGLDMTTLLKPSCNPGFWETFWADSMDLKKRACDIREDFQAAGQPAMHAMVAVGTASRPDGCTIKLRNSWGGHCDCFKPGLRCTKDFVEVSRRQLEKILTNVGVLVD